MTLTPEHIEEFRKAERYYPPMSLEQEAWNETLDAICDAAKDGIRLRRGTVMFSEEKVYLGKQIVLVNAEGK